MRDAAAGSVLLDERGLWWFAPFVGQERTLSDVARELSAPLNSLLYRVRRFEALGLLQVVNTVPRKGRAVRVYRAVADAFFVPYRFSSAVTPEELVQQTHAVREEVLVRSLVRAGMEMLEHLGGRDWGTLIYRNRQGQLVVRPDVEDGVTPGLLDEDTPAFVNLGTEHLFLSAQDAKSLQRELVALFLRYQGRNGTRQHVVRLALAPVTQEHQAGK